MKFKLNIKQIYEIKELINQLTNQLTNQNYPLIHIKNQQIKLINHQLQKYKLKLIYVKASQKKYNVNRSLAKSKSNRLKNQQSIEVKPIVINTQQLPECAVGKVGVIWVKGPSIVSAYLKNSSPESFSTDGWFRTGDLGYLNQDGDLYVVSRMSELIISGGENIYPKEVESVLTEYLGIIQAAVVGIKDDKWGMRPIAYLEITQPIDLLKLFAFLNQHLAKYKIPKQFFACDKLPTTASGKIAKHELIVNKERFQTNELT